MQASKSKELKKRVNKKVEKLKEAQADRDADLIVRSVDDRLASKDKLYFEKVLLSSPNDVDVWIQYISHAYETEGLQAAKKLGKRAMAVVEFKDQAAVLNLWKVMINLDFYYGTEESTKETFRQAVPACDHTNLCLHMIDLYKGKGAWETAEGFAVFNLKKSKKDPPAWSEYIKFLYEWRKQEADAEKAGKLDQKIIETSKRALQSIPHAEHKYFFLKRACVEYRVGEIEKGRTTLETLISKHPNKGDIWNIYVDQELKHGDDPEMKRQLLRRVCGLGMKPKLMKGFFTKWLEFEQKHGSHKSVLEVKSLASKYIEGAMNSLREDEDAPQDREEEI